MPSNLYFIPKESNKESDSKLKKLKAAQSISYSIIDLQQIEINGFAHRKMQTFKFNNSK